MNAKVLIVGLALLMFTYTPIVQAASDKETQADTETKARHCPVCGPEDEMEAMAFSYKYNGKKYSFCSMDCMKEFKKDPEQYLKKMGEDVSSDAGHEGHDHK